MNREMTAETISSNSNGTHRHSFSPSFPHKNGYPGSPTNGHTSSNGTTSPHTNGLSSIKKIRSPTFYGHDRQEVTRLLIQGLNDLGYEDSARRLGQESGFEVESPTVAAIRHSIVEGRWDEAEFLLFSSGSTPEDGGVSIRNGDSSGSQRLEFVHGADDDYIRFIIREQKYMEHLERGDTTGALMILQTELQPLSRSRAWDRGRLNALSALLVCNPEDLKIQARWDGAKGQSRHIVLSEVSKMISASVMIPEHRLAQLLDQFKQSQISRCLYHNPSAPLSLFTDHMCDRNQFPLRTSRELSQSDGQVWVAEFSHNGRYLATCGSAKNVWIYDTRDWTIRQRLHEHAEDIVNMFWSPDDSKLITCCRSDGKARVYEILTGRNLVNVEHNGQPAITAAWTPDGACFITGSLDRINQLCLWNLQGEKLHQFDIDYRVQYCAISPDGQKLVTISVNFEIFVYDFHTRERDYTIETGGIRMTSLSISRDSRYMLISMANSEVRLYDIATADLMRKYTGHTQGKYIIRSTFGGSDQNLIISGSEDSKIYIWHKENATLIEELVAHASPGCVNAVTWNPTDPGMFASGGDDKKVFIWTKEPVPGPRRRVSSHASSHRSNGTSFVASVNKT